MKTFITLTAMLLLMQASSIAQVEIGITAGTAYANQHQGYLGNMYRGERKAGFTAGILTNFRINKILYFQPSLNYVQKRFNLSETLDGEKSINVNMHYLELPLNLLFRTNNDEEDLLIGFGPYVSMGLSGNVSASVDKEKISRKIKFGNNIEEDEKITLGIKS